MIQSARRGLTLFTSGLFLGLLVTLSFTYSYLSYQKYRVFDAPIIPINPDASWHGKEFRGTFDAISWHDSHGESHSDEHAEVARALFDKVHVLCWVMTQPVNHKTKAIHVRATWGRRCNFLVFMSSESDDSLPAVKLDVPEGRKHLWAKTKAAFAYVYQHYYHRAEWFLKADDDTYVVLENLRHFLENKNTQEPVYYGHKFKPYIPQGYMSGGSGYVLSKEALKRLAGAIDKNECRKDDGGAEDLEMGRCMDTLGVSAGDTRDELNRQTFLPFVPEFFLVPGRIPKDNWFWRYTYYPLKAGPDCCSDYSIAFHYVPPHLMYVYEYMIYHMKPYGYSYGKQCETKSPQSTDIKYK